MRETAYRSVQLFKVLANPLRYQLLRLIKKNQPISTGELATRLDRSDSNTSQHLRKLKDVNLVQSKQDWRRMKYQIKRPELVETILSIEESLSRTDA